MVSRKRWLAIGIPLTIILIVSVSFSSLLLGTPHTGFVSEKQADEVSGGHYNTVSHTSIEGTGLVWIFQH